MFILRWLHNFKCCKQILVVTTLFITCKPKGSCIFKALPGVIVIWLERDERLLRAEEGREDGRLSETNHRKHDKTYIGRQLHRDLLWGNSSINIAVVEQTASGWLTDGVPPTLLQTVNTFWKERWGAQHHRHGDQSSQHVGSEGQVKREMLRWCSEKLIWAQFSFN